MSRVLETRVRRLEDAMLKETGRVHWLCGSIGGRFPDYETEKRWLIENGRAGADDEFNHVELAPLIFQPDHPKFSERPKHEVN